MWVFLADGAGDVERGGGRVEEDGLYPDRQVGVYTLGGGGAGAGGGDDFADGVRAQEVGLGDQVVGVPHVFGCRGEEGDGGFA